MRAAAYTGKGHIEIQEREHAAPGPGEVTIAVRFVGICGTDLHIFHGDMDARVERPAVIGHEMSGRISALGDGVDGWEIGESVTVMPLSWDDRCPACLAGHRHICHNLDFIGIDSPGALQEFWNVPASTLVRMPDDISLRDAALVEPVAVAVHDVRRAEIAAGDRVVVIGAGPIGSLIARVCMDAGAEVIVSEVDPTRREAAEGFGLEAVDPAAVDLPIHVTEWTGGVGADAVFEVSGSAAGALVSTALAKVRGTVVLVAIHPQPRPIDLHRVFWRELRILGARVYERTDFDRAVELIAARRIDVDALITGVVPLAEAASAFELLQSGASMKVLVALGGEA